MNVKEIVLAYLKEHGYDGLCNTYHKCGCGLGDLALCGDEDMSICRAARKKIATVEDTCGGEADFEVGDEIYVVAEGKQTPAVKVTVVG
jgi:hypothetical protein